MHRRRAPVPDRDTARCAIALADNGRFRTTGAVQLAFAGRHGGAEEPEGERLTGCELNCYS